MPRALNFASVAARPRTSASVGPVPRGALRCLRVGERVRKTWGG